MIPRVLEPEVMDSMQEALDYDSMDHSEVNRLFASDFLQLWDDAVRANPALPAEPLVLDVGTGTALIPIEMCRSGFTGRIVAIDLAEAMLTVGQRNVERAGLAERIRLERVDAKRMPYADRSFDAVVSNSIVHHVPDPATVFGEMVRVLRPGGVLFVRDLLRPDSEQRVEELVQTYCGNENEHQRQMFRDSLRAALTVNEVEAVLTQLGLRGLRVEQTSDRHWTVAGVPERPGS